MESRLKLNKRGALLKNRDEIKSLLEEEICTRYFYQWGRFEKMTMSDEQLKKAASAELIKTE